jgi:hypothetical protein
VRVPTLLLLVLATLAAPALAFAESPLDGEGYSSQGREIVRSCGDAVGREGVTASDALFILRVGIGLASCQRCLCDCDGSGTFSASDAQRALLAAIAETIVLSCPAC